MIRTNYSGDTLVADRGPRAVPRNETNDDELTEPVLSDSKSEGLVAGQSNAAKEQYPGEQIDAEITKKAGLPGIQTLINERDELRRQSNAFNEKQAHWCRQGEEMRKQFEQAVSEHTKSQAEYDAAQHRGDKTAMDKALGRISAASKKVESLKAEFQKHNSDSARVELAEDTRRFNIAQCAFTEKLKDIQWVISMLNPGVSCDLQQFDREYEQNKRFIESH
jgi:hypothetical protein